MKLGAVATGGLLIVMGAAWPASGQQGLSPLPASPRAAPSGESSEAPETLSNAARSKQLYEHVQRGVVIISRSGVPAAVGTVLAGDGRILTALSGLGGSDSAEVRYADGTGVHARLGQSDRVFDLALLVPDGGRWTEGLVASESEPMSTTVRAMCPSRGLHLGPAEADLKGPAEAHASGGEPLEQMLDAEVKGHAVAGAPLLDTAGHVVAVLVRACKGRALAAGEVSKACEPVVVGAPVPTLRTFLSQAPISAQGKPPWLGIRGQHEASGGLRGVRVVDVAPASPAEKAGLRAADLILAVNGEPISTPEELAGSIGKRAAGDTVTLVVLGAGKFRSVVVTLEAARPPVL
ncbi:MAG TPA: PDZ domain-containing protein [Polyangiaceae bacterium]|nr:PDZ domain-containing protein [Polyangiaceae bacterium]